MPERIHSPRGKSICLLSLFLRSCEAHIESPHGGHIERGAHIDRRRRISTRRTPKGARNLYFSTRRTPKSTRYPLSLSPLVRSTYRVPTRGHIERGAHIDRHRRISTRRTPKGARQPLFLDTPHPERCALTSHLHSPLVRSTYRVPTGTYRARSAYRSPQANIDAPHPEECGANPYAC